MIKKNYIRNEIKSNMLDSVFDLLKACNAMVVGGALTSILTRKEINDFDIYFKSQDAFAKAILDLRELNHVGSYDLQFLCSTDKSVTLSTRNPKTGDKVKVQFIHQDFYKSIFDVFADFDFTINMIGYDFSEDKVYRHKDVMQHLSQRLLCVNTGTKFPLVSVLRVNKYLDRGYHISKKEMVKLLLRLTTLELNSYEDVKKHVGGMYGRNIDQLIDTTKPFSIDEVLEQFNNLEYDAYENVPYEPEDYDTYIHNMLEDFDYSKLPYLKWVVKTEIDGVYKSWYDEKFEYKLGETSIPVKSSMFYDNSGIHCDKNYDLLHKGSHNKEYVLIRLDPVDESEENTRFKSGVKVVEELTGVETQEDWINWLYDNYYINEDVRNRMLIFHCEGMIYSGKIKKDVDNEVVLNDNYRDEFIKSLE